MYVAMTKLFSRRRKAECTYRQSWWYLKNETLAYREECPFRPGKRILYSIYTVKMRIQRRQKWIKIHLKKRHVKTVSTIAKIARKKTYMKR